MCSAAKGSRSYWSQNGSCGDLDIDEIVETVIDNGMWIVDGQEVAANESV
jgi:hypothetical protein